MEEKLYKPTLSECSPTLPYCADATKCSANIIALSVAHVGDVEVYVKIGA